MSDVHECPVCAQSSLLAVQQGLPGCEVSHDLVVILSTDLTTFWANSSTSGSIKQVKLHSVCFFRHFVAPHHPRPTTPMYSLVVLVKKPSKMVGNSASKPSNRAPAELPCITIDWWRSWHHALSRYTVINISKRDFSIFINARIRPFLQIRSHIVI